MRVRVEIVDGEMAWAAEVEDEDRGYTPEILIDWFSRAHEALLSGFTATQVTLRNMMRGPD